MNIIYSDDGLRATKYNESKSYSLDEITFFIEKKYIKVQFYCVIKDSIGRIDVVKMKQVNSTSASYYNYICSMDTPVKIKDGKCGISLMGINSDNNEIKLSSCSFDIMLKNDIYNFKSQIAILEEFNQNAANIYNKMLSLYNGVVEISNMNAELFDTISEVNIK